MVKRLSTVFAENELPPYLAQLLMRLHARIFLLLDRSPSLKSHSTELSRDEVGQRLPDNTRYWSDNRQRTVIAAGRR